MTLSYYPWLKLKLIQIRIVTEIDDEKLVLLRLTANREIDIYNI